MNKTSKHVCRFFKKSMSLVLAFSIIISVGVISGLTLDVSAATSNGQKIYINTNPNITWKGIPQLKVRMTDALGTELSEEFVASSNRVFAATAPSGATRVEVSSAPFTLPDTVVPDGKNRIVYKSPYGANTHVHYYGSPTEVNTEWPGKKMTQIGTTEYYYIDIDDTYTMLNFNNGGSGEGNQTSDLTINFTYSSDYAYYNGSNWANPYVKVLDLNDITTGVDTEYYMLADGSFQKSKYISTVAADSQNVTYKTVYVVNDKWSGINTLYATYDYSENYRGTLQLTAATTSNGVRVFQGKIPVGASVKFHPNKDNNVGASSTTMYPTGNSYDGSNYNSNTATYKITSSYEAWAKFSEINNISYDAVVGSRFHKSSNILGVDATYFDYISDKEMSEGYLNNQWNSRDAYNAGQGNAMWFPFSNFNAYISGIAGSKSAWQYPLYFGNLYNSGNQYGYSGEVGSLSKYYDGDYRYSVNNSNGLGNMNQSLQGLVYDRLDSNGNLQVANGVVAPYFDADTLSTATYNNNRVAKVFKSYFPFRASTSGDVTTYTFDSTDAKDNVYFTWDGTTPKYVNYGAGWQYQVWDANYAFGGSSNGKGIFPFNNSNGADGTVNTWQQTVDGVSYSRGGNNELDFGFGIRLDIDFRVPKYGTLDGTQNGTPVEFNYTGDDDLWVFIGEKENGADAELVLDLGGDHKKATGSIDFSTMTATANDVFANFGNSSSSSEVTVPSDEFWVKRSGNYTDSYYCVYTWGNWTGYVHPYNKDTAATDGYYKFKQSDFGGNTMGLFCKWENVEDGKLSPYDMTLSYGVLLNEDGTSYSGGASGSTNLGEQTKRFGQEYGVDLGMSDSNGSYMSLDPNKVYHMTVFYMERGLSESNFSVGFTMTPANNELEVTKELNTGDVIPAIADVLKANEEFNFEIDDNNSSTSTDAPFVLKDEGSKKFFNEFSTGSQINVNESLANNALKYDTSWELYDGELGTLIDSSTGTDTQFKLEDLQDTNSLIDLDLKYTNTIKTNDLAISKRVFDEDGISDYETAQRFTFQMMLDLDGDGSKYQPTAYPLEYSVDGDTLQMASDGSFTLGKDESITVLNIPVGATYTLKELPAKGFAPNTITVNGEGVETFEGTYTAVMDETVDASIEIANVTASITAVVEVNKTLDGSAYSGEMFTYTITGLDTMPTNYTAAGSVIYSISTSHSTETITKPDSGSVQFTNAVNLVEPGYYRYIITEDFASVVTDAQKADFEMDASTIFVEVDNTGDTPVATYCKVANSDLPTINSDADYAYIFNNYTFTENTTDTTFSNETTKAMITVNKKNQADAPIEDTVFALIKVSDEIYRAGTADEGENNLITGEVLEQIIDNDANMIKGTTNADGNVEFKDLWIYENGSGQFVNNNGAIEWSSTSDNYLNSTPNYQAYCIFEYSPANGYNPTNKVQYVTFPVQGQYSVTFDYVDGIIVNPDTSGNGMKGFVVGGMAIILVSALLAGSYVLYDRTERKKRMAKNGR